MEGQNYLGIYLSKDSATVVCLGRQDQEAKVLDCFSVRLQQQQQEQENSGATAELVKLIAEGCAQRQLEYSEVALALDCSMFMQHSLHSDFTDIKQIRQTIRYDTEQTLSTDVSNLALAFRVLSSRESGSELAVFTAQQQILTDIILALQSNNLDPITIEPDIICLQRFMLQNTEVPQDSSSLFAMLSAHNGYFLGFQKSQEVPVARTFLIGPDQDRNNLLARQIPLTLALIESDQPAGSLKVLDSANSVDHQYLSEKLGIRLEKIDPAELVAEPEILQDCSDHVAFAIAQGAALVRSREVQPVNFRDEFMPYQGRKLRLQKTLKLLSISVCVVMIALGVYFTSQLLVTNKDINRLCGKFKPDYSAITRGQNLPDSMKSAVARLGRISRGIQNKMKGVYTDEEDISAKLTLIFEAFNKCAKQTDLKIDRITVTSENVRIKGDTSRRQNTLKLFKTIREKLAIPNFRYDEQRGRDSFTATIVTQKKARKGRT